MPSRPRHPCGTPGCANLTDRQYCDDHAESARKQFEQFKGSAASRGYDWAWQKLAVTHKRKHPLCVECLMQGVNTAAGDVDHITPFQGVNDPLRLDPNNLQSLCRLHHNQKTHGTVACAHQTSLIGRKMTATGAIPGNTH